MQVSLVIYNLAIRLYGIAIKAAAITDSKAALWVSGRKGIFERMRRELPPGEKRIWIHCSSLGEFEQGRPVIETIRSAYPGVKIVLSFFSPSGYEVRKDYSGADHVFYLPPDTARNAEQFIMLVQPVLAVFVKYEFWYHYLTGLHVRRIPAVLISAVFRREQIFFRWYGGLFRRLLETFGHIFVQDEASGRLLGELGVGQVTVGGDTRFDRVTTLAAKAPAFPEVEKFTGGNKVLIAGSTWPEDEAILKDYYWRHFELLQMIIAPHETGEGRVQQIERLFEGVTIRHSELADTDPDIIAAAQVLIIDNVGMLAALYRYGFAAYVGGGFEKDGIHNILEAAVYGMPVFFGPNYGRFPEADELIARGAAFSVNDAEEFEEKMEGLAAPDTLERAGAAAREYVWSHTGATRKIMDYIGEKRFLTMA